VKAIAARLARHPVAAAGLFLALLPLVTPYTALAIMILVYGLYALGFNIMYGQVGLLSFGHSALLGGGAYVCGIALIRFGVPWWSAILLGTLGGTLIAFVMGALAVRTRGIYFAMVTLALSQIVYFGFYQAEAWTGGENGLRGVNLSAIRLPGLTLDFTDPTTRYVVVALWVWLAIWLLARIQDSAFGAAMLAVRENEARARACGFDVRLVRLQAMTLSGAFCGLAGALLALHLSIVPIETLHYTTSGQAVMMAILGGSGTFFGPFVGAAAFLMVESVVSTRTEHWPLVVGIVFVAFILLARQGLWGTLVARLR
jgi:branched-chain amino acid transport system permease protein